MKALITGASGYIGADIASRLAEDGYHVLLHAGANTERARTVLDAIENGGGSGRIVAFDLKDPAAIDSVLVPVLKEEGPLDILVNNAAVSRDGYMMMLPEDQWNEVLDVNLGGFFRVTRACLKGMVERRGGCIVNVTSLAGEKGNIGQTAYAASKAGLIGATKSLALEMARWNIRVNGVSPGPLEGGMASALSAEKLLPQIPLGRLGTGRDVAGAVSFLCSEDASYLTGQVISVNGGMGM